MKTALKDEDVAIDGSNSYLFEDKKSRYNAMNALASNYFQLYEEESLRVDGKPEGVKEHYTNGMTISNAMIKVMFDF